MSVNTITSCGLCDCQFLVFFVLVSNSAVDYICVLVYLLPDFATNFTLPQCSAVGIAFCFDFNLPFLFSILLFSISQLAFVNSD